MPQQQSEYKYLAAAGDNQIVIATRATLHGIYIGKDITNAVIEISNSATDGDEALVAKIEGSTLMTSNRGYIPLNLFMSKGITLDLTLQTNVTVCYSPSN